jgi:flagellar assembly protein FliH
MVKGETEGRKKAKAEFDMQVSLLQKKIASILETVEQSKKKIYTDSHDILLQLCFAIVQKMIHTECVTNKEIVLHVIKNSLTYISDREKIIIRVAPDDIETASGNMDFFLPIGERFESVVIEKDKRVEKGGCIIESNSGMADSRLGIQLEELKSLVETVWQSVASGI